MEKGETFYDKRSGKFIGNGIKTRCLGDGGMFPPGNNLKKRGIPTEKCGKQPRLNHFLLTKLQETSR